MTTLSEDGFPFLLYIWGGRISMLNVVIFCWIKPFGDFLSILVVPSIHEHLIILHVLIKHNKYICIHAPSFPKKKKKY